MIENCFEENVKPDLTKAICVYDYNTGGSDKAADDINLDDCFFSVALTANDDGVYLHSGIYAHSRSQHPELVKQLGELIGTRLAGMVDDMIVFYFNHLAIAHSFGEGIVEYGHIHKHKNKYIDYLETKQSLSTQDEA